MLKCFTIQVSKGACLIILLLMALFFSSCSRKRAFDYYHKSQRYGTGHSSGITVKPMWEVIDLFFGKIPYKKEVDPNDYEKWLHKYNRRRNGNFVIIQSDPKGKELYLVREDWLEVFWKKEPSENWLNRANTPDNIYIKELKIFDTKDRNGIIDPNEDVRVELTIFNADRIVLKSPRVELSLEGHSTGLHYNWDDFHIMKAVLPGDSLKLGAKIPYRLTFESGNLSSQASLWVSGVQTNKQSNSLFRAGFFEPDPNFELPISLQEDEKRREAVNSLYGEGKVENEAIVHTIERGGLIGDDKAIVWKALLMLERPLVYPASESSLKPSKLAEDAIKGIVAGARQKDMESVFLLSRAYFYGLGISKNKDLAKTYLQIAIDGGYLPAQIAQCADLLRERKESAVAPIQKLADAGSSYALFLLGQVHHFGLNGRIDRQKALELYRRANDFGIEEAGFMSELLQGDRSSIKHSGYSNGVAWGWSRTLHKQCEKAIIGTGDRRIETLELVVYYKKIDFFYQGIYLGSHKIEKHETCVSQYSDCNYTLGCYNYYISGYGRRFSSDLEALDFLINEWVF